MKQFILLFAFGLFSTLINAQEKVETINLKGTNYTVNKKFPAQIIGKYLYEKGVKTEEPIVLLNENGTGLFQPHMQSPIPIKFWIDCDEKGVIRKQEGVNGRYGITLLIQYGENSNKNYASNSYDLMGVIVMPDKGYAVIYGERYKKL